MTTRSLQNTRLFDECLHVREQTSVKLKHRRTGVPMTVNKTTGYTLVFVERVTVNIHVPLKVVNKKTETVTE